MCREMIKGTLDLPAPPPAAAEAEIGGGVGKFKPRGGTGGRESDGGRVVVEDGGGRSKMSWSDGAEVRVVAISFCC